MNFVDADVPKGSKLFPRMSSCRLAGTEET
jgi:hypothetical protein